MINAEKINAPQPEVIFIDGLKIPTWHNMCEKMEELQRQITVSKRLIAFQSVVIAFMALVQLLK